MLTEGHCAIEVFSKNDEANDIRLHINSMLIKPKFIIYIENNDGIDRDVTVESCARQLYKINEIILSLQDLEVHQSENEYLIWLKSGDILCDNALYEFASLINSDPSVQLIYCNEVVCNSNHVSSPFYKPAWSPDYLESMNYIGSSACYSMIMAREFIADSKNQYDFILRCTEKNINIQNIDKVLLKTVNSVSCPISNESNEKNIESLTGRLERTNRSGKVKVLMPSYGVYYSEIDLTDQPLVSIIIPTAGKILNIDGNDIDLISTCIGSIIKLSTYKNIEFIIIDNGDFNRDRLRKFAGSKIRYMTYSGDEINIAKKLNMGASSAVGEYLLLLNDDIQLITNDWIEKLLAHFEKKHVGAVGAKLLYPNMTLQHAGIVSIFGQPEHIDRGNERNHPGYYFSNIGVHNYLSVTGALTFTKSKFYRELGGYDEEFPLSFNDIDFCYRLYEQKLTVVYDPTVELIHYESVSSPNSYRISDQERFSDRWGKLIIDPYYNLDIEKSH